MAKEERPMEVIERAKEELFNSLDHELSPEETKAVNSLLYRCWKIGWLKKYKEDNRD